MLVVMVEDFVEVFGFVVQFELGLLFGDGDIWVVGVVEDEEVEVFYFVGGGY